MAQVVSNDDTKCERDSLTVRWIRKRSKKQKLGQKKQV